MSTQSLKPQTKLWVVALGIVISITLFTPPCFPLKESANQEWEKFMELKNSFDKKKITTDLTKFFGSRQSD